MDIMAATGAAAGEMVGGVETEAVGISITIFTITVITVIMEAMEVIMVGMEDAVAMGVITAVTDIVSIN
jgi:hypothetical protein